MEICLHCDEAAIPPIYQLEDTAHTKPFCCEGCITVYNILHLKGLESYYQIKESAGVFKRRSPVDVKASQYQFLDDVEFLKEYAFKNYLGSQTMEFYLEGIHCLACLWLVEKIPEFMDGVYSSKLDLDRSVVTVVLNEKGKFSLVAREFNQLGYRPHPLKRNQDSKTLKLKEERLSLIRIGVSGAAAGNIMIYAVSLYGGAEAGFAQLFNALTVAFALPVLTFSAFPFYQNAWNALKNRTLSIDIPISVSLIVGAVMGIYNLIQGIPDNYFDSLTALVFLLLLSRYFLQKIQEKGLSASDLHFFYQSESVLKAHASNPEIFEEVHSRSLKTQDLLKIRPGEFFPADGIVLKGSSNLNNALLTGESLPVKVSLGDAVFSGTQNLDQEIIIRVTGIAEETRLGRILKNVENGWAMRSNIINITNKVSKYFTLAVFALSAILFFTLLHSAGFKHALEGAITLLIVTCPCALALGVPLTFTRALSKAREQGIIIKSDEVIEKMAEVKNIFIDKTGTITFGKMVIKSFHQLKAGLIGVEDIIFNLESGSRHPVAVALRGYFKGKESSKLVVTDYREILGIGVTGMINGQLYEIKKSGIYENNELIATFEVEDIVRPDSKCTLDSLKRDGISITVLSGDNKEVVQKLAVSVGLSESDALFNLSPEEKNDCLKSHPHSMMIGDGANDAIALGNAHVGVAVLGAMDISLRAADVYLTTPGLPPVEKLFILSRETMKVIRRNLFLSLLYNSLSVTAAFLGIITPLIAAIIMPLSSLTVLCSTLIGTKKMRALWKS